MYQWGIISTWKATSNIKHETFNVSYRSCKSGNHKQPFQSGHAHGRSMTQAHSLILVSLALAGTLLA
ncbi:hypothetical protein RO3G_08624 [Rhizopus delemar RA 99-880]|uniref:Uncharacterized protein n=1 Tax=Rhizopus delemar (strain RA 99-880 / ATCC MYA-4621 / FGSC 9543 / NRRL 43880) TaxID=246409 RepID=I1C639_RHIO9|nr:hypothetical protein RO3G_08624 [Rhizopus delemar RA 99-880]|eukprot:EIE83919.1 hypothetical protein RO3G_08624 [Rhizopus delemar RA 99-880]